MARFVRFLETDEGEVLPTIQARHKLLHSLLSLVRRLDVPPIVMVEPRFFKGSLRRSIDSRITLETRTVLPVSFEMSLRHPEFSTHLVAEFA
jgi:hypothetical protein